MSTRRNISRSKRRSATQIDTEKLPTLRCVGMLVKTTDSSSRRLSKALKQRLGADALLERLTANLNWYEVRAKVLNGLGPAKSFEVAHALLSLGDVLAIEPSFEPATRFPSELDIEFLKDNRGIVTAKYETDPATDNEFAWHIEQVKAKDARLKFDVRGEGIRVAHLDTGYTMHPELVVGAAIRADLGYNFKDDTASPIEPLDTIDDGHGTATASVLVGIEGKQHDFPDDTSFVEGVAPGAELVPMRVDNGVYWIWKPKHDIRAIARAVDVGCGVISMSRSGLDYDSLHDAVIDATHRGLIVVAAAGNCIPNCNIYSPANYQEVVCAGGNTFGKKPWNKSSKGPSVTVSAPGHSIYRARSFEKNNSYGYSVERSSGTSYATPIIAGAAALWLELNGGTAATARKLGGLDRVAVVFKHLIATKGFQEGVEWNTSTDGPGILDCVKLLSAQLPGPDAAREIEHHGRARRVYSRRAEFQTLFNHERFTGIDGRVTALFALEMELAEMQNLLKVNKDLGSFAIAFGDLSIQLRDALSSAR